MMLTSFDDDIATVKVAIEICNNPELKREILCAPGSDYNVNKPKSCRDRKIHWNESVEKKATEILENLGMEKQLQEKVMGLVLSVGMRMLTFAEYHEGTLGFSREYSVNFLNDSFFTQQGIIDNKKAAEELMKDESLNIKQKYKLACLHCFKEHITALYRQMTEEEKTEFYDVRNPKRIKQPGFVKSWYYQMGEIEMDKVKGEKSLDQYRLEKAVKSGSIAAVEYCLEKTNLRGKKDAIIDAAEETVKNRIIRWDDWIVFRDQRYKDCEESSWIPSDYYIDVLYSLLSKMRDDQKTEFLKKDIEGANYESNYLKQHSHSRTLEYFLNWPYQDYFMKTAGLMWEFLSERNYADLLLEICNRFEPKKESIRYGEEKSFDYRKLLKEFWNQSPEHYKRYVLTDKEIIYPYGRIKTLKEGKTLLIKMFSLKNFTYEDKKNIELIFADATDKERENIIFSEEGKTIYIGIMKEDKWEILNRLVQNCFSSKEEADKFKRELSFIKEAQRVCIGLMKEENWKVLHRLVQNCFSSKEEADKFKRELIITEEAQLICIDFIKNDKWNAAESFIKWSSLPDEEINKLKKEMIYSENGRRACVGLISPDKKLNEGKWEEVEKFLTWCFSSEEDIDGFKKNVLLERSGVKIHFNLIKSSQFKEAETFFDWLGLSADEIKNLKKETLFNPDIANEFEKLLYSKEGDEEFVDYGSKQEAIELLLRWYLTDKETVIEFQDKFMSRYKGEVTEECKTMSKNFDLMIEQRLKDLDEEQREQRGVKRQSETSSQSKRLFNLKF